jgi:ribosomal-protein-alanine N-acetyltransferase
MAYKLKEENSPAPTIVLRECLSSDIPAVSWIEEHSFVAPWPPRVFRAELENDWSRFYVARAVDGDTLGPLVGYLIFWVVYDEVHVVNIAVHPDWRGHGVGGVMLDECIRQARATRCRYVTLEVRRSNTEAIRLYRGYGFIPVGVRPCYYRETGEDAIVMNLFLAGPARDGAQCPAEGEPR